MEIIFLYFKHSQKYWLPKIYFILFWRTAPDGRKNNPDLEENCSFSQISRHISKRASTKRFADQHHLGYCSPFWTEWKRKAWMALFWSHFSAAPHLGAAFLAAQLPAGLHRPREGYSNHHNYSFSFSPINRIRQCEQMSIPHASAVYSFSEDYIPLIGYTCPWDCLLLIWTWDLVVTQGLEAPLWVLTAQPRSCSDSAKASGRFPSFWRAMASAHLHVGGVCVAHRTYLEISYCIKAAWGSTICQGSVERLIFFKACVRMHNKI